MRGSVETATLLAGSCCLGGSGVNWREREEREGGNGREGEREIGREGEGERTLGSIIYAASPSQSTQIDTLH